MFDRFNRHINYLRISVTDRCNLRCTYCMPEEGIRLIPRERILSYEEITSVVQTAVKMGIDKVRLTGGEPLVRPGIVSLVKMLSEVEGIRDLSLTTNGILLSKLSQPLRDAGLQRVNISLDTTDAERFRQLTRGGHLADVFRGIRAAREAGLQPIKINCVIFQSRGETDALLVKSFCEKEGFELRYIHQMNLATGEFSEVEGGNGGACHKCNRLRMTAEGMIKPCLFDEHEFSVRELGADQAIRMALEVKPQKGCLNTRGAFYAIGG